MARSGELAVTIDPRNPEFRTGPLTKAERRIVQGWEPGSLDRANANAILRWAPKAREHVARDYPSDPLVQLRHHRMIDEQVEWANDVQGRDIKAAE